MTCLPLEGKVAAVRLTDEVLKRDELSLIDIFSRRFTR